MILHPTHACPDFLESFSDFVDGTLPPYRRDQFQAHLDCCERCLSHLAAYRRGVEALAELSEVEVEPEAFWARLQHRIWHQDLGTPERPAWRLPSFAALATAAVAIAVVWTGLRIGAGLERVAERSETPVVVMAGPPVAAGASQAAPPESREAAAPAGREAPSRTNARAPVRGAEPAFADPLVEREFRALRARIETEAWLGPSEPVVSHASLESGLGSLRGGGRIQLADVRAPAAPPRLRSSLIGP